MTQKFSNLTKPTAQCLAALISIGVIISCSTVRPSEDNSPKIDSGQITNSSNANETESAIAIGDLPAQTLKPGQCGLFLFTPFPSPRFVFFSESATNSGKIILNGQERKLELASTKGALMDQHYTDTVYKTVGQTTISVEIDEFERTEIGVRIETGLINIKDSEGWNLTVPVSGRTACYNQGSR